MAFKILGSHLGKKIVRDDLREIPIPLELKYNPHLATTESRFSDQQAIRRSKNRFKGFFTLFFLPSDENIYKYEQSHIISKTPLEYYEVNCNVYPPTAIQYGKKYAIFEAFEANNSVKYHLCSESVTIRPPQPTG